MNINFLKSNEHAQTEEFLDMLYTNNILPIITKPTRLTDHTATLIDHIYTNCLQNFTAGILTVDITSPGAETGKKGLRSPITTEKV